MNDIEREAEIKRLGQEIEKHVTEAETGCYFMSMGRADAAKSKMYQLIASRPLSYVQKLELQRGFV